jgi:hypothetical protein
MIYKLKFLYNTLKNVGVTSNCVNTYSPKQRFVAIVATAFLLFFTPLSILAQKKGNPYRSSVKGEEPLALRIGGMWHPYFFGGKIGFDLPFRIVESRRLQGSLFGGRSFKEWYVSGDIGWWHFPNNTVKSINGFELPSLSAELTHRRISGTGFFVQGSVGVGGNYLLPSFEADSNYLTSSFESINQWFLTPSVGVAIGKDFALSGKRYRRGVPLVLILRGNFSGLLSLPKFEHLTLVPAGELAIAYRFAAWQVATRQVRRN